MQMLLLLPLLLRLLLPRKWWMLRKCWSASVAPTGAPQSLRVLLLQLLCDVLLLSAPPLIRVLLRLLPFFNGAV